MTILYFYQYFTTPQGSWSTRVYEFTRRWVAKGATRVIVVTSIYDKSDLKASGIASRENFDGVEVIILNIHISNRHSKLRRIWTFIAYALLSNWYAITLPADVVVASSGPITVSVPGLVAHYLRRRKLVMEVRDLWPEGAIEMGMLGSNFAKKMAFALARACYNASEKIVTLSPGMRDYIKKHYGVGEKAISIPNASDNVLFSKDTSGYQIPDWAMDKYIFLYTGNIGEVNNSWWIIKAAETLVHRQDILFMFIGEGQQRKKIEKYIIDKDLRNVRLIGLMPKNDLVAWVQRAYCMMVPFKNTPVLNTSSPNKLFDALAAGTPIIQNTQGWIKGLLHEEECGITIPADRPDLLAQEVQDIVAKPEVRDQMGRNGKRVAQTMFDRDLLSNQMYEALKEVVTGKKKKWAEPVS